MTFSTRKSRVVAVDAFVDGRWQRVIRTKNSRLAHRAAAHTSIVPARFALAWVVQVNRGGRWVTVGRELNVGAADRAARRAAGDGFDARHVRFVVTTGAGARRPVARVIRDFTSFIPRPRS